MNKYFTNTYPIINLYKKKSVKSEIITQMIYGDSFLITNRTKKWLKIKIKEDNYKGYIENRNFNTYIKPTHKVAVLKATIYKLSGNKKKISQLSFGSKIQAKNIKAKFIKFENGWIHQKNIKPIKYKEKNIFNKIKLFKNIKYKWGGKSFKGIDCSALIQIFFNFNNKFCPRDAKDQVKHFNKAIAFNNIKKYDIIYWQGHVAVFLSKKKLIHAYGPKKKVIIGSVLSTTKLIQKTANLKILKIVRI
jgi:cell wall-associated NlpC family hydrolase